MTTLTFLLPNPLIVQGVGKPLYDLITFCPAISVKTTIHDVLETLSMMYYNDIVFIDDQFDSILSSTFGDYFTDIITEHWLKVYGFPSDIQDNIPHHVVVSVNLTISRYIEVARLLFQKWAGWFCQLLCQQETLLGGDLFAKEINVDEHEMNPCTRDVRVNITFTH